MCQNWPREPVLHFAGKINDNFREFLEWFFFSRPTKSNFGALTIRRNTFNTLVVLSNNDYKILYQSCCQIQPSRQRW